MFTSTAEARRRAKEASLKALDDSFTLLQLYERGTELCKVRDVARCAAIDVHDMH